MNLLVLDTTSKIIEAVLAGAVSANQPEYTTHYADATTAALTEGSASGALNDTTDVTIVAAPGASTQRIVKEISIYNKDTAAIDLTIKTYDGSNERIVWKGAVDIGATWTLSKFLEDSQVVPVTHAPVSDFYLTGYNSVSGSFSSGSVVASGSAAGAVLETDYNANTILAATADDTPLPITIGEQTVIGRITSGEIKALSVGELQTLANVEDGADVTDATNVNAAGATMNADADISGNGWFLDEDNMASDSAVKVASQQSIKKYVDDNVGGATTALDNLAAVAINESLISDTDVTDSLGSAAAKWLEAFVARQTFVEAGSTATPAAGDVGVYAKADGLLYSKDDAGLETPMYGGLTVLFDEELTVDASEIDITGIPSTYKHLIVFGSVRSDRASTGDNLVMRVNNNSTADDHVFQLIRGVATTLTGVEGVTNLTGVQIATIPGGTATARYFGTFTLNINDYTDAAKAPAWTSSSGRALGVATGNLTIEFYTGILDVAGAVTQLTFYPLNGANLEAGTRITVCGVR